MLPAVRAHRARRGDHREAAVAASVDRHRRRELASPTQTRGNALVCVLFSDRKLNGAQGGGPISERMLHELDDRTSVGWSRSRTGPRAPPPPDTLPGLARATRHGDWSGQRDAHLHRGHLPAQRGWFEHGGGRTRIDELPCFSSCLHASPTGVRPSRCRWSARLRACARVHLLARATALRRTRGAPVRVSHALVAGWSRAQRAAPGLNVACPASPATVQSSWPCDAESVHDQAKRRTATARVERLKHEAPPRDCVGEDCS